MNTLDVLVPTIARVDVVARDREELLRSLVHDLFRAGLIAEEREPLEKLLAREAVQSTALGGGIALPHARTAASPVHRLAAVRVDPALDYDAPDGIPVDLVFLLLGPPEAPGEHVKLLARIAKFLQEPGVIASLRAAPDSAAFRALLEFR